MKKNIIISICLGLITALLVIFLFKIPAFQTINARCMDLMFSLRGDMESNRDIVLLEIDDKAIDALAEPLKKEVYSRVVEMLSKARARVIGFDMLFSDNNSQFASAIAIAGNVSLGFEFMPGDTGRRGRHQTSDVLGFEFMPGDTPTSARRVALPNPGLLAAARSGGHISILPDRDGIVRRIPLLLKHTKASPQSSSIKTCLPLQMVIDSLNVSSIGFDHNGIFLDKFRIPTDESYQMLINYSNNGFRRYSLMDVMNAEGNSLIDPFYFKNKMVLIGVSKKTHRIPTGNTASPLYIHANILNNILTGNFLAPVPEVLNNASLLLIGIGLGIILSILPYSSVVIITLCGCLFYVLICFISFNYSGLYLSILPPIAVAAICLIIIGLYRHLLSINDVDRLAIKMKLNEARITKLQRENEKISLKLNPSFRIDFRTKEIWYPSTAQNATKITRDFEQPLRILECLVHERWGSDRPEIHWVEGFIIYSDLWTKDYPLNPEEAFNTFVDQLNMDMFGRQIGIKKRVILQTEGGYCSLSSNIRCESNVKSSIRCFKKAYELFQVGKLEEAEKGLEESVEFDAENIRFLTLLGDVRAKLGKEKEAMDRYVTAFQILNKEIERIRLALNIFQMREDVLLREIKGDKKRLIWKGIEDEKAKMQERIGKLIGLNDYLSIKLLSMTRVVEMKDKSLISLLMDSALLTVIRDDIYSSFLERGLSIDKSRLEASYWEMIYPVVKHDISEISSNVSELKKELMSQLRYRVLECVVSLSLESRQIRELCLLWDMEDRFQLEGLMVTQEEVLKEFGWGARYYHSLKEIERRLTYVARSGGKDDESQQTE